MADSVNSNKYQTWMQPDSSPNSVSHIDTWISGPQLEVTEFFIHFQMKNSHEANFPASYPQFLYG